MTKKKSSKLLGSKLSVIPFINEYSYWMINKVGEGQNWCVQQHDLNDQ
jgi:hypothetical protein